MTAYVWAESGSVEPDGTDESDFRVIAVGVEQRLRAIGFDQFGFGDRAIGLSVVQLVSQVQYPTRDRDGDTVGGQVAHERVEPYLGKFAVHSQAVAWRSTSFSCSRIRLRLRRSCSSADSAALIPGRARASISALSNQFRKHVWQIPKSSAIRLIVTPASRRSATATTSSRNSHR